MPRHTVVDPRFGTRMRELREVQGKSLRSLERPTLSSKSKLHKIETGVTTPSLETARLIDEALQARGELIAMVRQEAISVLPRREFLGVAATAASMPALSGCRQVTGELIDRLLVDTARLRRLDDYLGGADTYATFSAEVAGTTRLLHEAAYQEATGRRLLRLLAEQAQLTGWAAFDAGWQSEAYKMFALSLNAAREADDAALVGNAMAFVGYQGLMMGRSAVKELTTATETVEGRTTPTVLAMLHTRRAWAHANDGQTSETQRHLDIAQGALRQACDRSEPDWVYWVDDLEHEIMTGRCWTVLRRPVRAIAVLSRAVTAYDETHGRDKALYLSFLADAYLDANELEQASSVTSLAMDLSAGVGSVRPRIRIESVVGRMDASAQCVRELREKARDWLSVRRLSAEPNSDSAMLPQ